MCILVLAIKPKTTINISTSSNILGIAKSKKTIFLDFPFAVFARFSIYSYDQASVSSFFWFARLRPVFHIEHVLLYPRLTPRLTTVLISTALSEVS